MSTSKTKSSYESLIKKQQKRIEDIIEELQFNYYSIVGILNKINFKPTFELETFAVDQFGRGVYNPEFASELSKSELRFIIMHEVYHVLLRHIYRFNQHADIENNKDTSCYMPVFNIAADAFVNDALMKSKYLKKGVIDGLVTFDDLSANVRRPAESLRNMTTEDLFDLLLKEAENQAKSSSSGDSGKDSGDQSSSGGDESSNGNGNNVDEKSNDVANINDLMRNNQLNDDINSDDAINNTHGNLSEEQEGAMQRSIEREIQKSGLNGGYSHDKSTLEYVEKKCNANLDEILESFVYKVSGRGEVSKTYRRQNKYYREIYPFTKGRLKNKQKDIVFSIDVSGSMNKNKISTSIAFMDKYQKKYGVGCKYFFFSDRSTDVYEYTSHDDFINKLHNEYGGGTVIDAAIRPKNKSLVGIANGLVILSDMEFFDNDVERKLSSVKNDGIQIFGIGVDASNNICKKLFEKDYIVI